MERDKSVLLNKDIFSFHFLAQPQELVRCKFWRFVIYIGVYGVRVCDFLNFKKMELFHLDLLQIYRMESVFIKKKKPL